jgi:uncharacterized protein (DUF1778 family)
MKQDQEARQPRRKRESVVELTLTSEEKGLIRQAAERRALPVTTFVRVAALAAAQSTLEGRRRE